MDKKNKGNRPPPSPMPSQKGKWKPELKTERAPTKANLNPSKLKKGYKEAVQEFNEFMVKAGMDVWWQWLLSIRKVSGRKLPTEAQWNEHV